MALALSAFAAHISCLADEPVVAEDDARVAVQVSALNLLGVAEAQWTLRVEGCALVDGVCEEVPGEPVFEANVSSTAFGDGAGSITYVGPCDASTSRNRVSVTLLGLYDEHGVALPFRDPGALTRWVDCLPNADTPVTFDVVVMRPASQGFLDLAVSFDTIHCSAKYDCAAQPLLHTASGERGKTHILGFACAAAPGSDGDTQMVLDPITIACGAGPVTTVTLHPPGPDGSEGNQGAAGPTPETPWFYQWAVFRGDELLPGVHKRYFNVALGVDDGLPSDCTLTTRGTAGSAGSTLLVDGAIADGAVYPIITWTIDELATCSAAHGLDAAGSQVTSEYTSTEGPGVVFAHDLFGGDGGPSPCGEFQVPGEATCVFSYTGAAEHFVAPPGVTEVTVSIWGAGGGGGGGAPSNYGNAPGGAGGFTRVAVDTGAHPLGLEVRVGGGGERMMSVSQPEPGFKFAGAGGGASGVYTWDAGAPVAVAGGGGGSAWYSASELTKRGGAGGGVAGTICDSGVAVCGGAGTQSSGGSGGTSTFAGGAGSAGVGGGGGGNVAYDPSFGFARGGFNGGGDGGLVDNQLGTGQPGGGGGGGWFGGGGGGSGGTTSGGGGGGSGYVSGLGVLGTPSPVTLAGETTGSDPAIAEPPMTHDPHWQAWGELHGGARPVGYGGCSGSNIDPVCHYTNGGHGLVVITW